MVVALAGTATSRQLLDLADRIKQREGDAAVVLGARRGRQGRAGRRASVAGAVERGRSAVDVIREAAAVVGGGGGGRPEVAQAGGREPEQLDEALEAAREAIRRALS